MVFSDQMGVKRMRFLELSKVRENFEKISFLPRIKGVFSLAAKAQVTAIGSSMIFILIRAMRALTDSPPIPWNFIREESSRSIERSCAAAAGIMEQSAPVSTRKSKFWYPYLVKIGMRMMGSARIPSAVRFSPNGNSPRIDTESFLGRNVPKGQGAAVQTLLPDLANKSAVGSGACEDQAVLTGDEFSSVTTLKLRVGNFSVHTIESIPWQRN